MRHEGEVEVGVRRLERSLPSELDASFTLILVALLRSTCRCASVPLSRCPSSHFFRAPRPVRHLLSSGSSNVVVKMYKCDDNFDSPAIRVDRRVTYAKTKPPALPHCRSCSRNKPPGPLVLLLRDQPSFKGTFSFSKSQLRPHKNCEIHPFPCSSFGNVQMMLGVTEPLISCSVPLLFPIFGKREMGHAQQGSTGMIWLTVRVKDGVLAPFQPY